MGKYSHILMESVAASVCFGIALYAHIGGFPSWMVAASFIPGIIFVMILVGKLTITHWQCSTGNAFKGIGMMMVILVVGLIGLSYLIQYVPDTTTCLNSSEIVSTTERWFSISTDDVESLILKYTNDERKNAGLKALSLDEKLAVVARMHSDDMANNDYFSHTNLKGDGPTERASKNGYSTRKDMGGGTYMIGIGENIGKMPTGSVVGVGYVANNADSVARAQVDSWMESSGHRQNILDSEYTNIGIGVAYDGVYYYCTQDFW